MSVTDPRTTPTPPAAEGIAGTDAQATGDSARDAAGAFATIPFDYAPPVDPHPRDLILRLAQKITDRVGHHVTAADPEYWGLACLVTDEMARVALKMKVRSPKTLNELSLITGMPTQQLEPLLEKMAYIGLLEFNWENPTRTKQYVLLPFVPGSAEFFNMRQSQIDEHPEVAKFFERMTQLPIEKITPMVPPGGAGIGMHVIPVERAIEMENESVSVEHISHWLDTYDGKYAASPCSCRMSRAKLGEGCADDVEDWCIGVGDMADYLVDTQRGHYIDRAEVLRILEQAEKNGFVHQITNIDGERKIFAICNCNVQICNALRTSQLFNTPNMSRSAYVAHVEAQACTACGRCTEVCPAGAVKLGQKLCGAHGPVTYPQVEDPADTPWGPEKWNPNYRNDARVETHDSGTAPCKVACPAHIAVQGYLKLAAQGRYTDALALIKRENPFPAVCGRVCNRRCEDACTRGLVDDPVAIDDVKDFIARRDLDAATRYVPEVVPPSARGRLPQKIAIVGAGPAGLSCAFFLAQRGYSPMVIDRNPLPGGMLTYGIPSYKLEKDVVQAEIDVLRAMGVQLACGVDVGRDVTLDDLRAQGYEAFYLAIGCQDGTRIGVPGEDARGVESAVAFLHDACRGERAVRGNVVVVGGGNVAVDAARVAKRAGAASVTMVALEQPDDLPATPAEVADAETDGVSVVCGWGPKQVFTRGDGRAYAVEFKRCTAVTDGEGCFAPRYDKAAVHTLPCDTLVLATGQRTAWGSLLAGSAVELDERSRAVADARTYQTAEPDVFVGGDAFTGPSFAIDAIAAGKQAAESIHRFVHPAASLTIGRDQRHFVEFDKRGAQLPSYDTVGRQRPGFDRELAAAQPFADAHRTLTEEQVRTETARCLSCGVSVVDPHKCIGCGLCTTRCAFNAITLHRDIPDASRMYRTEDKLKAIAPYAAKRAIRLKFGKKRK